MTVGAPALLIDLDGVVRRWDPERVAAIERNHGIPAGSILTTAFATERITAVLTGRISDRTWRLDISDALEQEHGPQGRVAAEEWTDYRGAVAWDVLEVVRQARRRMPILLISNATSRLREDLAVLGILDDFDFVLSSSDVGAVKPDAPIYVHAARTVGREPAACIFVDDQAANVATAQALGMTSQVFESVQSLAGLLRSVRSSGRPGFS